MVEGGYPLTVEPKLLNRIAQEWATRKNIDFASIRKILKQKGPLMNRKPFCFLRGTSLFESFQGKQSECFFRRGLS